MKKFGVVAAGLTLLASAAGIVEFTSWGNDHIKAPIAKAANSAFQEAQAPAKAQAKILEKSIAVINDYADSLLAGKATPEGLGACQNSLQEIQNRTVPPSNQPESEWYKTLGQQILARRAAKALETLDPTPCPTIEDFKEFGKDIFNSAPKDVKEWHKEVAGFNSRLQNIAEYNSKFAAGSATADGWKVCQGSLDDLEKFRKEASPALARDKVMLEKMNANRTPLSCPPPNKGLQLIP